MNPFLRFLAAARSLANQGMSKEAIEQFAKNEFGKINTLMQKQINNIFKPSKPIKPKDPDFDDTVKKLPYDDQGKPFNPKDPLKDYSKKAEGGIMRVGLKEGEGIMKMAGSLGDEKDDISREIFGKPVKDLNPDELQELMEELERLREKFRAAQGGRAGFKEGTGMFEELFFSKDRPILSGLNTAALFDLVVAAKDAAGPLIGFADGGRIGYKEGPKDPRRRTFMKAAVGLASLLPFGIGRGVKMAAPAVSKAAELTGPALDKIVETVMTFGKMVSLKGKRVKEMVTKKKHEGVEVTEDVADQSYIIKKGDKEIYYKPGRQDETGGFEDDIIEVIEDRVKKAGGGIGYMLGE
jgi:hypothetical protein